MTDPTAAFVNCIIILLVLYLLSELPRRRR